MTPSPNVNALLVKSLKTTAIIGAAGWGLFKVASSRFIEYLDAYQSELSANEILLSQFNRSRQQAKELSASFLPEIQQSLNQRYNIEALLARLHSEEILEMGQEEGREAKLAIWNEIKLQVVSKMITFIYGTSLLAALIAVQMAVIGKYMYVRGLFKVDGLDPDEYRVGLEDVGLVGKYTLLIASRFAEHGLPVIDEAVKGATSMVLSRVDVQDAVTKDDLDTLLESIRHEIEDAAGRSLLEETIFSHDTLLYVFSPLQPTHRPLANGILENLKDTFASSSFKTVLSMLVKQKFEAIIKASCEELFAGTEEPLLLSIIPNIHGQLQRPTAKIAVRDDAPLTALMAQTFKSTTL